MARSVDKRDFAFCFIRKLGTVVSASELRGRDRESADRLRDCTVFFRALVEVRAKGIQQSSFSVVDMSHDGDDGRSTHELMFLIIVDELNLFVEQL